MASVQKLIVKVEAQIGNFKRKMNEASASTQKLGGFAGVAGGKLGALAAGGLAGGAIAATLAMARMVGETARAIDQIGKFAKRIGIAVNELAALQFAAQRSGISQQQLNLALQRSTRRIAEAAKGSGEAVKAIDELGLSAEKLGELTPDQQLLRLAGAFESVGSESDKVRLAFKLFDSEGVALLQLLREGEAGVAALVEQGKKLRTITEEDAKAAADLNDSITDLSTGLQGLTEAFATRAAPQYTKIIDGLVRLVIASRSANEAMELFDDTIRGIAAGTLDAVGLDELAEDIRKLDDAFDGFNRNSDAAFQGFVTGSIALVQSAANAAAELSRFNASLGSFTQGAVALLASSLQAASDIQEAFRIENAAESIRATEEALQHQIIALAQGADAALLWRLQQEGATDAMLENVRAMQEYISLLRAQEEAARAAAKAEQERERAQKQLKDEGKRLADSLRTPIEEYNDELKRLKRLLDEDAISQETFRRAVERANKELEKQQAAGAKQPGEFRQVRLSRLALDSAPTGVPDLPDLDIKWKEGEELVPLMTEVRDVLRNPPPTTIRWAN